MSQRASSAAPVAALLAMGLCFLASCDGSDPADTRPGGQLPGAASESQEPSHVDDSYAGAWLDVTHHAFGPTEEWTGNVEAADIDSDGDVDLLFANSGTEQYWSAWRTVCS